LNTGDKPSGVAAVSHPSRLDHNPLVFACREIRLDAAGGLRLQKDLLQLTTEGHDRIILDMSRVESISSSAIASLLDVFKALGLAGALVLAGLSERLTQALAATRMDRIFLVRSDIVSALKYFAA
jgi:anti-sigma B factor antagonist